MDPDLQHHDAGDDVVAAYQDRVAAEQQQTRALAAFQARVAAISRPDLAAVSEAARSLFSARAWETPAGMRSARAWEIPAGMRIRSRALVGKIFAVVDATQVAITHPCPCLGA